MANRDVINEIVSNSLLSVIENKDEITMDSLFTGGGSSIESIDVVQIISAIEEGLNQKGILDYDLFEAVFRVDSLTFNEMVEMIYNDKNK